MPPQINAGVMEHFRRKRVAAAAALAAGTSTTPNPATAGQTTPTADDQIILVSLPQLTSGRSTGVASQQTDNWATDMASALPVSCHRYLNEKVFA